ncbi:MAG: FliG C-terminal domain-containing protein, partial [Pirellulales bacterium]
SERLRAAGLVAVAGILEAADPALRRQILGNLACFDPPLAGKLRTDQFEFSRLSEASPAALATLLQSAERQVAVLALAGATPGLVQRVLAGLPAADARLLEHDVDNIGPTRLSDVEEAQSQMAELAQQLAWLGRMELPASRAPVLV